VDGALDAAGGDPKVAIVSLLRDVDADGARARLAAAGGVVRKALDA
jgi:N-acetylmuramic acid 6-phosphate (MurNAc-6-P) etherase